MNAKSFIVLIGIGLFSVFPKSYAVVCTMVGQHDRGTGCQCPKGYEVTVVNGGGSECRPVLPSQEYFKGATPYSDGYPVCGLGRIPVNSGMQAYNFSAGGTTTPGMPRSLMVDTITPNDPGTPPFRFATNNGSGGPNGTYPIYKYSGLDHCACSNASLYNPPNQASDAPLLPTGAAFTNSGGVRFLSDSFETISAQTTSGYASGVSQIAIATDGQSNGYLGSIFGAGNSVCGCPNVNEIAVSADPTNSSQNGTVCKTMMDTTDPTTISFMLLASYDPTFHASQKFSTEPSVATVKLPAAQKTYQTYKRRIWTCAPPLEPSFLVNKINCVFNPAHHSCDDGGPMGVPSAVSTNMKIGTAAGASDPQRKFNNTVNKRLACCLNEFDPLNPNPLNKFDCVDNSSTPYADFDTLWQSTTEGQPNALALANASSQLISGFYAADGNRCAQFSEFASINGPIRTAKINHLGAIDYAGGTTITQPSFVASDLSWSTFLATKKIPSTVEEMKRCPILVRAAMRSTCSVPVGGLAANARNPSDPKTIVQSFNDGTFTRCAVASSVTIILRVEQLYEFEGAAKMKAFDALIDSKQAITLQVQDLIKNKTLGKCPVGATLGSDGICTYP